MWNDWTDFPLSYSCCDDIRSAYAEALRLEKRSPGAYKESIAAHEKTLETARKKRSVAEAKRSRAKAKAARAAKAKLKREAAAAQHKKRQATRRQEQKRKAVSARYEKRRQRQANRIPDKPKQLKDACAKNVRKQRKTKWWKRLFKFNNKKKRSATSKPARKTSRAKSPAKRAVQRRPAKPAAAANVNKNVKWMDKVYNNHVKKYKNRSFDLYNDTQLDKDATNWVNRRYDIWNAPP